MRLFLTHSVLFLRKFMSNIIRTVLLLLQNHIKLHQYNRIQDKSLDIKLTINKIIFDNFLCGPSDLFKAFVKRRKQTQIRFFSCLEKAYFPSHVCNMFWDTIKYECHGTASLAGAGAGAAHLLWSATKPEQKNHIPPLSCYRSNKESINVFF